jgi:hypothetical protein
MIHHSHTLTAKLDRIIRFKSFKKETNSDEKTTAQVNAGSGDDYELRWEIGTPP